MILHLGSPIGILTEVGSKNNDVFSYVLNRIMVKKLRKVANILLLFGFLTFDSTIKFCFNKTSFSKKITFMYQFYNLKIQN